jgi:hypothetical protein
LDETAFPQKTSLAETRRPQRKIALRTLRLCEKKVTPGAMRLPAAGGTILDRSKIWRSMTDAGGSSGADSLVRNSARFSIFYLTRLLAFALFPSIREKIKSVHLQYTFCPHSASPSRIRHAVFTRPPLPALMIWVFGMECYLLPAICN